MDKLEKDSILWSSLALGLFGNIGTDVCLSLAEAILAAKEISLVYGRGERLILSSCLSLVYVAL